MNQLQKELLVEYLHKHFTFDDVQLLLSRYPLTGEHGLRRILGEIDIEYFCRAYLTIYFDREFGEYASEILVSLKKGVEKKQKTNIAVVAPRGHGKSTLATVAVPAWCVCYNKKKFVLFVSANADTAQNFLVKIQRALESPEIKEDFGDMKERHRTWNKDEINTSNNAWVVCSGWESGLRGMNKDRRPDLIILDDLEDKSVIASESMRKKLEEAFRDEIGRLGDYDTDMFYIGTLLAEDALLAKVIQEPSWQTLFYKCVISFPEREDLWETWRDIYNDLTNPSRMDDAYQYYLDNKEDMIRGAKVLWEGKYPEEEMEYKGAYYNVMLNRMKDGEDAFWKEDQNEPQSNKNRVFQQLQYYKDEGLDVKDIIACVLAVDPSLAKNSKSDFSALTTLGRHKNNFYYVLNGDARRLRPNDLIKAIIDKLTAYPMITHIGIESVNFQALLVDELKRELLKKNIMNIKIIEINTRTNKHSRIVSLEPSISNGYIKFNERDKFYNEQVLNYSTNAKNDDAPDSLELAMTLLREQVEHEQAIKRRQALLSRKGAGLIT